ncbi:MAG: hypothetical protein DA405_13130 [Bacteroidetes bacterium]|nr:MAG: hypothetical protein DA405_13130 [Bacteroidota bacterium]
MKLFLLFSLLLANSNSALDLRNFLCSGFKTFHSDAKVYGDFWFGFLIQGYSVKRFSQLEPIHHTIFKAREISKSKRVSEWPINLTLLTVENSCLIFRARKNNHI